MCWVLALAKRSDCQCIRKLTRPGVWPDRPVAQGEPEPSNLLLPVDDWWRELYNDFYRMRVENVRIVGGSWLCWEVPSAVGSSDFESRGAGALTTTARKGGGDVQFKVPAHCGATRRSSTTTGDGGWDERIALKF